MLDWTHEIDKTTEEFEKEFGSLSPEQLNWKPNPDAWSIAQIIEHLIITNETYFPILDKLKSGLYTVPFIAKIPFAISLLGKLILKAVSPDTKKKVKTFPIWQPASGGVTGDILRKFRDHQEELKNQIEDSSYLVRKGAVISSPANKNIVYKLGTAFDIIVTHEQRHLGQAKALLQTMK